MESAAGNRPLRVACFVPTFNAGDTTRGIEVCRALVETGRERGREVDVEFVFARTERNYEEQIVAAGFRTRPLDILLDERTVEAILMADHTGEEFVSDLEVARSYLRVGLAELKSYRPSMLVYGFVPPAGIVAQLLKVPSVAYLPFPAHRPWARAHLVKDIPDDLETRLTAGAPKPIRRAISGGLSRAALMKPFFQQPTFAAAGRELGWKGRADLFQMLAGTLELVNDLPAFFDGHDLGPRTRVTGPLFSKPVNGRVDPRIREIFAPGARNRVFVSMGSSGQKKYLLTAIEAVASMQVRAVAVVPPRICSLEEVRRRVRIPPNVLLTDEFVPAHQVNAMADAAIIHGGQGTVQTAIHSGTPVVGVGMQLEQSMNLDNLALRGAGIRIARGLWNARRVASALAKILREPGFRSAAERLRSHHEAIDGRREAGRAMWEMVESQSL